MKYRVILTRFEKLRGDWVRYIVVLLLMATAAADFVTFFIGKPYRVFDMSLLTIITDNIIIIFLVKFVVIGLLVYLLLGVKKASDYWRYLWVMMAVYLIFFQVVGALNNYQVREEAPPVESGPSVEVRAQVGISFALLYAYYPIAFAMLCFWLWSWGWKKKDII
jgi:hypothetical protein